MDQRASTPLPPPLSEVQEKGARGAEARGETEAKADGAQGSKGRRYAEGNREEGAGAGRYE